MGIFDVDENVEKVEPLLVKVFKLLEIVKEGYIQGRWLDARDDPEKYPGINTLWKNKITHPDFDDVWILLKGVETTKSLPSRYFYKWEGYIDKSFHTYMKELGVTKAYKDRYIPEDITIIRKEGVGMRCNTILKMIDVMLYDKELFDECNFRKYVSITILNEKLWTEYKELPYIQNKYFPAI